MKKTRSMKLLITMILLISFVLTGCNQKQEDKPAVGFPTTDRAGNEIIVPEKIDGIISMAPSNTEIIKELGLEDKIIAADTQTAGYGMLSEDLTYFDMMAPDAEQIIALNPDIVFVSGMSIEGTNDPFKQIVDAGICVAYIPSSNSIEGVYQDIMFIANVLEVEDKGQAIVDSMSTKIEEYKEIASTIAEEDKKTIYFEIAAAPAMYSFGNGTFLNEIIEIVGGKNILADQESWLSVSEENVMASNPDVIITNVNYIDAPVEEILSRPGWNAISAVENKEVYYINNQASTLPSHNIVLAIEEIAKVLYPELY